MPLKLPLINRTTITTALYEGFQTKLSGIEVEVMEVGMFRRMLGLTVSLQICCEREPLVFQIACTLEC